MRSRSTHLKIGHPEKQPDPRTEDDGIRVLVDRLWPRGARKEDAAVERWLREAVPSKTLWQWFNHEPEKVDDPRGKQIGVNAQTNAV